MIKYSTVILLLGLLSSCGKKVDRPQAILGHWQDDNDTHLYYNFIDPYNWYCIRDDDTTTIIGGTYQFINDNRQIVLGKEYRRRGEPADTFNIRSLKKKTMEIRQLGWARSVELYKLND